METIGKGGFGMVYKGTWKGSVAAIKVSWLGWGEQGAGQLVPCVVSVMRAALEGQRRRNQGGCQGPAHSQAPCWHS